MTDLKNQLSAMFADEPPLPHDLDRVVQRGRRTVRRRRVWVGAATTTGVAGVTAAIVVPLTMGGHQIELKVSQPAATPSAPAAHCNYWLIPAGRKGPIALAALRKRNPGVTFRKLRTGRNGVKAFAACPPGATLHGNEAPSGPAGPPEPNGPPYSYTEEPATIAADLGQHLQSRVQAFGLTVTYTRPFAQETSTLEQGHPKYFTGNVDVRETQGYGDIGVQVTHRVTEQVPFTDPCDAASGCAETTFADGSVLRTGRVDAGPGSVVLTAEIHRPDGVIVAAQESNYAFGPDAGNEAHGSQPLSLEQLASLAQDEAFTF